ncbi:MAG TPA: permease prefix domain 1-containing protein [Candidatus Sulfotelmatobacter sp.]|jgi:hypothetical protein
MSLLSRLFANRQRELEEEIQSHLQMAIQDRTDRGESAEQAEAAAIRELGNFVRVNDITRETRGWVRLERIVQDLKYALRHLKQFLRKPAKIVNGSRRGGNGHSGF